MAAGRKTGGRQKGVPNKATAAKAEAIAASGVTPLDYMLNVMRDESADAAVRFEAAKSAAPYVHPRLAAVANLGANVSEAFMKIWSALSEQAAGQMGNSVGAESEQPPAVRH